MSHGGFHMRNGRIFPFFHPDFSNHIAIAESVFLEEQPQRTTLQTTSTCVPVIYK